MSKKDFISSLKEWGNPKEWSDGVKWRNDFAKSLLVFLSVAGATALFLSGLEEKRERRQFAWKADYSLARDLSKTINEQAWAYYGSSYDVIKGEFYLKRFGPEENMQRDSVAYQAEQEPIALAAQPAVDPIAATASFVESEAKALRPTGARSDEDSKPADYDATMEIYREELPNWTGDDFDLLLANIDDYRNLLRQIKGYYVDEKNFVKLMDSLDDFEEEVRKFGKVRHQLKQSDIRHVQWDDFEGAKVDELSFGTVREAFKEARKAAINASNTLTNGLVR